MEKIHKATTLAVLFNLAAIACLLSGFVVTPMVLSLIAFFAAIKDLPVYTSKYQFITILVSTLVLGLCMDLPNENFPLTTISLLLLAVVATMRIAFFRIFSYTSYIWFEPITLVFAVGLYIISNIMYNHDWKGYLFPLPIIIFDLVFTWGTIKDKNQLLKEARGGYRVQLGKAANDFELPDQDGNTVKLSDLKDKRHILLIFVRGDWCPGCHMMLRTYEKNNEKFKSKNILVMAIGPDPVGVNRGMVEKLGLDFKVLSDEGQRTAMIYGVQLKEYDNAFAEKYDEGIPLPASFLIDKSGIVRYVSRPDKVGEFLNPSLIFPIVDQLDQYYVRSKVLEAENDTATLAEIKSKNLTGVEKSIDTLKKELDNYQSIIEQANDAILVVDIVDGRIRQSNPSASKLLEYGKDELESHTLFDLQPKEFLDKSSKMVADVWEKGGLIYTDIPFVTKSNEIIPVECSAKVAPYAGRPAIVIYARDIRERLKMEREITAQRKEIDAKSQDIRDSIEYSKRIQRSILIEKEKLQEYVPDSFILFKPRDVVSGDFYWFDKYDIRNRTVAPRGTPYQGDSHILVVAAIDCTGHGVPGAFMSIIGNNLLNQTLDNTEISSPAEALDFLDKNLKKGLNKNAGDVKLRDGMDISLVSIDLSDKVLEYAGANNPIYIVRNNELIVLKADKQPITASLESKAKPFTNQVFKLEKNDAIYLFTDGYADQFGGEDDKKFMYKRFKETLVGVQDKCMNEQMNILETTFEKWKGSHEQVDDVLVIGIKI
ncbi:redoxin domain-containing protein [Aurantibacillus circumpalustris]|uniref:redoxin domain-containing protein n=1 Tax=Aurantibacillus circumpalustris TaxID=3036359 RepID=UPI00295B17F5|nr:redoxin domain-containing protein [Aurantibacillus circumpalustris]